MSLSVQPAVTSTAAPATQTTKAPGGVQSNRLNSLLPTPTAAPTAPVTSTDDSSTDLTYTSIIKQMLTSWGIEDLFSLVDQLGRTGASADEINLKIQQSDAYKKRFAGNETRLQNGLGVLDPASYIALEGQYRQILSQLPAGFYDSREALAGFIGGDVSPAELSDRVRMANDAYVTAPQGFRDAFDAYYGHHGVGGAIAAILDTNVAEPLLQQQVTAAGIGGAALGQGLQLTSNATAMKAAQQGVTIDQARQAYQQIASRLSTDQSLSGRFGTQFGQSEEEQSTLLGDSGAFNTQNQLYSQERAQFQGHGGASSQGSSNSPGSNY